MRNLGVQPMHEYIWAHMENKYFSYKQHPPPTSLYDNQRIVYQF
jgi:hypothetical protein